MEPMQFVPASAPAPAVSSAPVHSGSYQPKTIYEAVSRPAVKPAVSFAEAQKQLQQERQVHYQPQERHEQVADGTQQIDQSNIDASTDRSKFDQSTAEPSNAEQPAEYTGRMIPIGQVDLTYIIAQDLKGLYIIDQHAAHERILFDKLSAMADGIPSQQLLVHQLLTFDRKEAALVEDNKELFAKLGFHLEAAGDFDYRLMEVPADVPVGEAEDIIREILMDLGNMHETTAKEIRQACLATTACRAAIKAGEELNMRQMEILLDELSTTAFPYTCPHGRPTILKFSSEDLAKMFKRTGFGF